MPQHKGKVERGVSYVRDNALKGRRFQSLAEENAFLGHWGTNVADKRIHGRPANRSPRALQKNAPICSPYPLRSFPAIKRPDAR